MSTSPFRAALLAAALAVPIASCSSSGSSVSSSSSGSTAPSAADIKVTATNLAYDSAAYTAKAGDVKIELDNRDPVAHNVTLVDGNKLLVEADPKKSHTATQTLTPGTYQVYCSVPGHNMKATLTITP